MPCLARLFATDSSESKGAIVSAPLSEAQGLALWKVSDRKGAFCKLERPERAILRSKDPLWEEALDGGEGPLASPSRPLAFHFDFLEVFSGAAVVTQEMARRGYVCGPPIDIDRSVAYDVSNPRLLEWVFFLIERDRVDLIHLSPPCTTSSAAAYPPVRNRAQPRGFDPSLFKTRNGTLMALRALAILLKCVLYCVMASLEQPRSSIMATLKEWVALLRNMAVGEYWTSSCAFGSRHQKQFRFLTAWLDLTALHRPCRCSQKHVPVRGRWAKASATYTPGLVHEMGRIFGLALRSTRAQVRKHDLEVEGLERASTSTFALSLPWEVDSVWRWPNPVHINILESSTICRLFLRLACRHGPCRFAYLCDSHVAQSAIGKGRSGSGLRHVCRRSSCICLAAGLYPGSLFCPTRLMPADHPTRDTLIPSPVLALPPAFWTPARILVDGCRPRLRKTGPDSPLHLTRLSPTSPCGATKRGSPLSPLRPLLSVSPLMPH